MAQVTVTYTGYELKQHESCFEYDKTKPVKDRCVIHMTDKMYDALNADDNEDTEWAWDLLEETADAMAKCVGHYLESIERLDD